MESSKTPKSEKLPPPSDTVDNPACGPSTTSIRAPPRYRYAESYTTPFTCVEPGAGNNGGEGATGEFRVEFGAPQPDNASASTTMARVPDEGVIRG